MKSTLYTRWRTTDCSGRLLKRFRPKTGASISSTGIRAHYRRGVPYDMSGQNCSSSHKIWLKVVLHRISIGAFSSALRGPGLFSATMIAS